MNDLLLKWMEEVTSTLYHMPQIQNVSKEKIVRALESLREYMEEKEEEENNLLPPVPRETEVKRGPGRPRK